MGLEGEIVAGAATAALTGNIGELDAQLGYLEQKLRIDSATMGGGGDVRVDLDALVEFYNALSELHTQLVGQTQAVGDVAADVQAADAGGKVPGVQRAWTAIAQAAGAGHSSTSLKANLAALDRVVVNHMIALQHNAQQYAANEDVTVVGLGKAANAASAGPVAATSAARPAAVSTTTPGFGGR